MTDEQLKALREKWDDSFIINGGDPNTADKLEVITLVNALATARAELDAAKERNVKFQTTADAEINELRAELDESQIVLAAAMKHSRAVAVAEDRAQLRADYNAHLDWCFRCRTQPSNPCASGLALLAKIHLRPKETLTVIQKARGSK